MKRLDSEVATELLAKPQAAPLGALVRTASGITYTLRQGQCIVGSGTDCHLQLADASVSRQHVSLELDPFGVRVRDLGSTNGTFYLGQRIQDAVLGFGSQLIVGQSALYLAPEATGTEGIEPHPMSEYRGLIGQGLAMRQLFSLMERLEGSLATVLVEGESGAGKDLVARALHQGSRVASGPFVPLNCGALPRELVASELFGHRRGAFSGAVESRSGAFASADGGTLFLDEIGELPLDVQPNLLRVLETGELRAVGEDHPRHVRVRVIAATNRELATLVQRGGFRQDLYFRLAVVKLTVPPLRDRKEDIAPLVHHFASSLGLTNLATEVVEELRRRTYVGNVRELRNVVEAYTALRLLPPAAQTVPLGDFSAELRERVHLDRPYLEQRDALMDAFTKVYLEALLDHTGSNRSAAARVAGIDRTYLAKLMARNTKGSSKG